MKFNFFSGGEKNPEIVEAPVKKIEDIVVAKKEKKNFSLEEIAQAKRDLENLLEKRNALRIEILDTNLSAKRQGIDISKEIDEMEFAGEAITGTKFEEYHKINQEAQDIAQKYGFDFTRVELPYLKQDVDNQEARLDEKYPQFRRKVRPYIEEVFRNLKDSRNAYGFYDVPEDKDKIIIEGKTVRDVAKDRSVEADGSGKRIDSALQATAEIMSDLDMLGGGARATTWKELRDEIIEKLEEKKKNMNRGEGIDLQYESEHVVKYSDTVHKRKKEMEEKDPVKEDGYF